MMVALCTVLLAAVVIGSAQEIQDVVIESGIQSPADVQFDVEKPFKLLEGKTREIPFFSTLQGVYKARISNEDDGFATVSDFKFTIVSNSLDVPSYQFLNETNSEAVTVFGSFNVTALFIGYSTVNVTFYDFQDRIIGEGQLEVRCLLSNQLWSNIYGFGLSAILVVMYINMGATLNIEILKKIVKMPIGPAIGLVSQYVCMPMIAYGLGLVAFPDNNLLRLGLFASGSSPGGGLSNMWTHLLGGSLDLSIMMTFVSTVAALGMVPLWLLTVGQQILTGEYTIPYENVLIGIVVLVVPVFIGLLVQIYYHKATIFMKRLVTPISIFLIIFILTVGLYANLYMFAFMDFKTIMVSLGQCLLGHLAGLLLAVLSRRNTKEVIAISIETAVQNNAIGHLFLRLSIEAPAGDLAAVIPGCVFLLTPFPLLLALFIKKFYTYYRNSKVARIQESPLALPKTEALEDKEESGLDNFAYAKEI